MFYAKVNNNVLFFKLSNIEQFISLGLLAGLDIVEVNPSLENKNERDRTVNTAIRVTEACLGKHRSGYIAKRAFDI